MAHIKGLLAASPTRLQYLGFMGLTFGAIITFSHRDINALRGEVRVMKEELKQEMREISIELQGILKSIER